MCWLARHDVVAGACSGFCCSAVLAGACSSFRKETKQDLVHYCFAMMWSLEPAPAFVAVLCSLEPAPAFVKKQNKIMMWSLEPAPAFVAVLCSLEPAPAFVKKQNKICSLFFCAGACPGKLFGMVLSLKLAPAVLRYVLAGAS